MKYGRYGWSYLLLRYSIGITLIWMGIDLFRHPDSWARVAELPIRIPLVPDQPHWALGGLGVVLGVLLVLDYMPSITTLGAALLIGFILVQQGLSARSVFAVGALGASLALLVWPHHHRRHWLLRWWSRRRYGGGE